MNSVTDKREGKFLHAKRQHCLVLYYASVSDKTLSPVMQSQIQPQI